MPLPALSAPREEIRKAEAPFRAEEERSRTQDRTADPALRAEEGRARTEDRAAVRDPEEEIRAAKLRRSSRRRSSRSSIRRFEQKNGIRLDDEVRFIRTWIEKPLTIGAVTPSGQALARTMAAYVDPDDAGPDRRARPRHRPGDRGAGRAGHRSVAARAGRVRPDFLPAAARALSGRHGGAGRRLQPAAHCSPACCSEPAAAVVSGLPLFTKPLRMRLRLLFEAFA